VQAGWSCLCNEVGTAGSEIAPDDAVFATDLLSLSDCLRTVSLKRDNIPGKLLSFYSTTIYKTTD
jgi:hypothetical protein